MATVSLTKGIVARQKDFFDVVCDYQRYPEFISEIINARMISVQPKRVEFTLELVKTFHYVLEFKEKSPTEISWKLVDSNLFKKNSGGWRIQKENGALAVTYSLDVEFGFLVPSVIVNRMVKKDLPKMIDRFSNRVLALHG